MITQYVFMIEEVSMEKFLDVAIKELLPAESYYRIIPHEGKQDMEKSIPKKLRAWKNNQEVQYQFIIIRDKDSGDCVTIKNKIKRLCRESGRDDAVIIIAIHELEAWFLGDLKAVGSAYNINGLELLRKKKTYRNPDRISNASEQLYKLCKDRTKISRDRIIAAKMDFNNNQSQSFNYFLKKIMSFNKY